MDIIYNKIFSRISNTKNNNGFTEKVIDKVELNESDTSNSKLLSDSPINIKTNNNLDYDSEQMPSSISSIDSINSIDSDSKRSDDINNSSPINKSKKKKNKVNFNDEIKISEITDITDITGITSISGVTDTNTNIQISHFGKLDSVNVIDSADSADSADSSDSSIKSKKSIATTESDYSHESKSSSNSDSNKKLTIESVVEKKYLNSLLLNKKKFYEEIKALNNSNLKILEINVIKNIYSNVLNLLTNGDILYKKDDSDNVVKICSNKNCSGKCEENVCNKNGLYYSLWNNIRGVKTIYNLLIKIIIIYPQFRNRCKCCEDERVKQYLDRLENNYNQNIFNYEESNVKKLELKINFLINKFMSVIGIMICQCKFINKYYEFYQDNYLNFRKVRKIYMKTVPFIIPMLKLYFSVKENHEELTLIKNSRCMHEDIRYNNFTYCLKKIYNSFDKKKLLEIICNLELVSMWTIESFDISLLLFNEQSLETFRHVLYRYKKELKLNDLLKRIYDKKNDILDLNYVSNKKNLLNSLLNTMKNNKNFEFGCGKELINTIIAQLYYRNKKYKDAQIKINNMMIQYLIECLVYNQEKLGLEFFKNIKDLDSKYFITKINKTIDFSKYFIINTFPIPLNKNSSYGEIIKYIFDTVLESDVNYQIKISYLKIINKNKINIIQYDFINKLIDIADGEKIIQELRKNNKNDNGFSDYINYFLDLDNYHDVNYVNLIIKKCVVNQRVNNLDYLLYGLNLKINERVNNFINPYIIYFVNISDYKKENEYIELLNTIIKYKYNLNNLISDSDSNYNFLHFCIKKNLNNSAKILINNFIDTSIICENKNLLFYSIDFNNHIIFGEILNKNEILINQTFDNIKLHTYLFMKKELEENILMRFLIKLLKSPNFKVNHYDKYNLHLGFQILESSISKRNKILLFKLLSENIDCLVIKNNIPLIMYSVIFDEYEISYILLNKLLSNKNIKKISSNTNPFLDYECTNEKININFIPLIFKYIKENASKNQITINEIYLEVDSYIENILIMIMEIAVFLIVIKNKLIHNKNKKTSNKMNSSYYKGFDGYLDIDKNILSEKEMENGYMEISIDTDNNTANNNRKNNNRANKNIWIGKKTNISNENGNDIKFKFKSESMINRTKTSISSNLKSDLLTNSSSESSEIEESEICFDSII